MLKFDHPQDSLDDGLTTKHQVDKSHLHPPCQLRGRGGIIQSDEHFNYWNEGSVKENQWLQLLLIFISN